MTKKPKNVTVVVSPKGPDWLSHHSPLFSSLICQNSLKTKPIGCRICDENNRQNMGPCIRPLIYCVSQKKRNTVRQNSIQNVAFLLTHAVRRSRTRSTYVVLCVPTCNVGTVRCEQKNVPTWNCATNRPWAERSNDSKIKDLLYYINGTSSTK